MADLPDTIHLIRRRAGGEDDWRIVDRETAEAYAAHPIYWEVEERSLRSAPRDGAVPAHRVQRDVLDFHRALELTIGDGPPALRDEYLRAELILEEAKETAEAMTGWRVNVSYERDDGDWFLTSVKVGDDRPTRSKDLADAIDGLCDLLCVIYGAAVTWGIDLAPFWAEVHRSNLDKQGGPKSPSGKQLKPDGWRPPDIPGILAALYPEAVV